MSSTWVWTRRRKSPRNQKKKVVDPLFGFVCIYIGTHTHLYAHTHAHKHTGEEGGAVKSGGGANAGELGPNDIYPV